MTPNQNKTVWTSELGDLRRKEQRPTITKSQPPQQQTIYIYRDSKNRGGKKVTLLKGFNLADEDLIILAKKLKQSCGSGGTVKDGSIEIQGEHRDKIAQILIGLGYKIKFAGG